MDHKLDNLPQFDSLPHDNLPKLNMCNRQREREMFLFVFLCGRFLRVSMHINASLMWIRVTFGCLVRLKLTTGFTVPKRRLGRLGGAVAQGSGMEVA